MSEPNIAEKIIGAIDRAITGKPAPKREPVFVTGDYLADKALPEIKKLDGFEQWLAAETQIRILAADGNMLHEYNADEKFYAQQREHEAMLADGKKLSEIPRGRSREGWQSDFAARKSANDAAIVKLMGSITPFRKKIADAMVEQLNKSCAELMLEESRLGAKFGIPYKQSPTLQTLRASQHYLINAGPGLVFNITK